MIVESELAGAGDVREVGHDIETHINSVIDKYKQYVNPGLTRLLQFGGFGDLEESAEGCVVTMATGAHYLDFLGGYGIFSVGHRHPKVVQAVHRQLDRMPLSTRAFFHEHQALLSEKLAQLAPGGLAYTFYSNSGAEAVEAALKIARIATGRSEIVSTEGSFHGKTLGALSVTGREKYRQPFEPLLPGVSFVPYNDIRAAEMAVSERTAAFIIEPIQGEGGIIPAEPGYLCGLRRLCDEHGALLIADEVQTGLGRTGKMFGVNHENVVPDVMTLAKALGGGVMPIGATMATADIWEKLFGGNPMIHTSTFGGNQLACAAALAALEVIENERLIDRAVERGEQLMSGLRSVRTDMPAALHDVRGRGLMIGVEFAVQDVAELTINGMTRRGIIAGYTLNNPRVIRFEPPLVVTAQQVDVAVAAFRSSVAEAIELLNGVEE